MVSPVIYSVLIASVIPLVFLVLVKWLNFFETHRARLIFLALGWGVVAVGLSYLVNHPLVPIVGRPYIATHTAPPVEEIFKSMILLYLVRRADYTHFVDGAIYGFAAGIGFAVAENMLYLSRLDVDTGLLVSISRAFSSAMMHGSTTAMVGIAIGGFPYTRKVHPMLALAIGWAVAIAAHVTYNHEALTSTDKTRPFILLGIAFASLMLVGSTILWGLHRERRRFRASLGLSAGLSSGEAKLIQRIDDLDDLLAPIEARFGERKGEQVRSVLLLGAQLGMKQDQLKKCPDAELRAELGVEIAEMKRVLKRERRSVGLYAMSYARSILPKTTWSIWARLGQVLEHRMPSAGNMWAGLGAALAANSSSGRSIYAYVQDALDSRQKDGDDGEDDVGATMQQLVQRVAR